AGRPGERVGQQQREGGAHRQIGPAGIERQRGDLQPSALTGDDQRDPERGGQRGVAGAERQPARLGDVELRQIELTQERVLAPHRGRIEHRIADGPPNGERTPRTARVEVEVVTARGDGRRGDAVEDDEIVVGRAGGGAVYRRGGEAIDVH